MANALPCLMLALLVLSLSGIAAIATAAEPTNTPLARAVPSAAPPVSRTAPAVPTTTTAPVRKSPASQSADHSTPSIVPLPVETTMPAAPAAPAAPVAPPSSPSVSSSSVVVVVRDRVRVPDSVDATGERDVSAALVSFFERVSPGSTVVFPAGGRYRVESGLFLGGRRDLVLEGNGALLFADSEGDENRSILRLNRSTDIVVRDLVIRGANPQGGLSDGAYRSSLEAQHGVQLNGVDGVVLERLVITDVYGDFVYVGGTGDREWSRRVVVRDSRMERNGRQGVAIVAGEDVLIEGNTMDLMRRAAFDIEPNHQWGGVKRVRIVDNRVGAHRLLFLPVTGVSGAVIEDIEVARNHLFADYLRVYVNPPDDVRRARIAIVDNTSDLEFRSSAIPIIVRRTDDVVIRGNRQHLSPEADMTAMQFVDVCRVAVADNDFTGAAEQIERRGEDCGADKPAAPRPPRGIG